MSQSPGDGADPEDLLALAVLFRDILNVMRRREDDDDIADAEAAWAEGGEPVSFGDLEAEFA
jgi:hypothetical protein